MVKYMPEVDLNLVFSLSNNVYAGGAVVCGLFYMVDDAIRSAPVPKPQGSPQPPLVPTQGRNEGQELDTWNSLETQANDGDWVITDQPSGEVLESEDLGWGSK